MVSAVSDACAGSGRTPRGPPRARACRCRRGSGPSGTSRSPTAYIAGRQDQDALGVQQLPAELLHVAALVPREADTAAVGRPPVEEVRPAGEEVVEQRPVGGDDAAVALPDRVAMTERERREVLGRAGVADAGVVLALLEALEQRPVAAGDPADAQPRQAVGLGGDVQRDGRLGKVGGLGDRPCRVDLDAAVDLVAEQPDAALVAERDELAEGRLVGDVARSGCSGS